MYIENIRRGSDGIRTMEAGMRNISVEEYEKQQLDSFHILKNKIQERILWLK